MKRLQILLLNRLRRYKSHVRREIASHIAAASFRSFFCDCRYGFTNCGPINRNVCPKVANTRAQWCALGYFKADRADWQVREEISQSARAVIASAGRPDLSHQPHALGRHSLPYQRQSHLLTWNHLVVRSTYQMLLTEPGPYHHAKINLSSRPLHLQISGRPYILGQQDAGPTKLPAKL